MNEKVNMTLAKYMDSVVFAAYNQKLIKSNVGSLSRFSEVLMTVQINANRAVVWNWLKKIYGIPQKYKNDIRKLNRKLHIEISEEEFNQLFTAVDMENKQPVGQLFQEIERTARTVDSADKVTFSDVLERLAVQMNVSVRTLYNYRRAGMINPKFQKKFYQGLKKIDIDLPNDILQQALPYALAS